MSYVASYKIAIIVSDQDRGNGAAIALTGNPEDNLTFSVPLSSTGEFPATHWGCCTSASEVMRETMLILNEELESAFATSEIDGLIVTSSYSALVGLEDPWEELLNILSLKVCRPNLF